MIQTMCSIVAHENEFQLLFQKFALPFLYNGIRWIGPRDVMFSKHSSTFFYIYVNITHACIDQILFTVVSMYF